MRGMTVGGKPVLSFTEFVEQILGESRKFVHIWIALKSFHDSGNDGFTVRIHKKNLRVSSCKLRELRGKKIQITDKTYEKIP